MLQIDQEKYIVFFKTVNSNIDKYGLGYTIFVTISGH